MFFYKLLQTILQFIDQFIDNEVQQNAHAQLIETIRYGGDVRQLLQVEHVRNSAHINNNEALLAAISGRNGESAKALLEIPAVRDNAHTNNNEALRMATLYFDLTGETLIALLKTPVISNSDDIDQIIINANILLFLGFHSLKQNNNNYEIAVLLLNNPKIRISIDVNRIIASLSQQQQIHLLRHYINNADDYNLVVQYVYHASFNSFLVENKKHFSNILHIFHYSKRIKTCFPCWAFLEEIAPFLVGDRAIFSGVEQYMALALSLVDTTNSSASHHPLPRNQMLMP